jgi:septum site-determining protein MinC
MPTMSQTEPLDQDPVFQLKGSMLAITVLELARNDLESLDRQLAAKVAQAPNFFSNAPLVLALDKLPAGEGAVDLPGLMRVCRQHGLRTLAIRASRIEDIAAAIAIDCRCCRRPAPVSGRWTPNEGKKNRKNRRSRPSNRRKSSPRQYAVASRSMPRAATWW